GVARLDRVDPQDRREHPLVADPRRLRLVGGDREVLERDGGSPEALGVLRRAAEVVAAARVRPAPEDVVQSAHVRALVRADDGRLALELAGEGPDALDL